MGLLRLLLAVSVVIAHAGAICHFAPLSGQVAVETFFMISGFYMAMILNEKYRGEGSYRLFISNRFLRIYPMYWVVLIFSLAINGLIYHKTGTGPLQLKTATGIGGWLLVTISNLVIFGQDLVMFVGSHPNGHLFWTSNFQSSDPQLWNYLLIPPAWSLGIELVFYLIAPLIVRRATALIALLVGISLGIRGFIFLKLGLNNDPWTYRFFPSEIAFFLAGALGYRIYVRYRHRHNILPWLKPAAIIFFACVLAYQPMPDLSVGGIVIKQWMFYLLAWIAIPFLFLLSHRSRIDRYIGELSYPIYIIHFPMLRILGFYSRGLHLGKMLPITGLLATLLTSVLITWLVAIPLEKLRQKRVYVAHHNEPVPVAG